MTNEVSGNRPVTPDNAAARNNELKAKKRRRKERRSHDSNYRSCTSDYRCLRS